MLRVYELAEAQKVAEQVAEWLRPACTRLEIVGSVRRQRARVHDIDLLAFPKIVESEDRDLFGGADMVPALDELLPRLSFAERLHVHSGGEKYKKLVHAQSGIPVDLYLAGDMTAWWTLLVIRTGSAVFNKRLCTHALEHGMRLHADGKGVERACRPVKVSSERAVFQALKFPWREPRERE